MSSRFKGQKGYIIKTKNGDTVVFFAPNIKAAKAKFHKIHHGSIKTIRVSKRKRD